jgi:hypothetical protein
MKILFFLAALGTLSLINAVDTDFDGVDDTIDKCPNTPFSDLADPNGCTTSSLYTPTYYDIIIGANYASSNPNTLENSKTYSTTFQADFYKGNVSGQIQSSYYQSDVNSYTGRGWNDTQLSLFYLLKPTDSLTIQAGAGVIFPTYSTGYNNEATDYLGSLSLRYMLNKNMNLFGGYTYTMINDKNIQNVADYQNTNAFHAGVEYIDHKNNSINLSYTNTQSIYAGVDTIETLSCGVILPMTTHWFVLGDYRYGVSDSASDHEAAVRIGYTF